MRDDGAFAVGKNDRNGLVVLDDLGIKAKVNVVFGEKNGFDSFRPTLNF